MKHVRLLLLSGLLCVAAVYPAAAGSTTRSDSGAIMVDTSATYRSYLPLLARPWQAEVHDGIATFYDATGAGNCSFDPSPEDLMVTAINTTEYAGAALCGAFVEVVGPRGTVTVRIVDSCPDCSVGHLDLSVEAFARIADPVAGRVPIRWQLVSPALSGPIVYHFKVGSNPFWTAVQIRNHRSPIAKVEYQTAGGSYLLLPRVDYNFFVAEQGLGPGPYTFRVTDIYGHSVTDTGIPLVADGEVPGAAQLPPP